MFCQLQHVDVVIDDWLDWLDRNAQGADVACGLKFAQVCSGIFSVMWWIFASGLHCPPFFLSGPSLTNLGLSLSLTTTKRQVFLYILTLCNGCDFY